MADPIIIYTDGAASGNPGPGGFGVVLKAGVYRKELMAGFRKTTNNRMELLAVIVGLEALKQPGWQVVVYSDSRYVVDAVEKGWVFGWEKKGFKDKKNPDLWKRFLAIYRQHQVKDMPISPKTNVVTSWLFRLLKCLISRSITIMKRNRIIT